VVWAVSVALDFEGVRMKKQMIALASVFAALAAFSNNARADMLGGYGGTGSPPPTVGGFDMVQFTADPQPVGNVTSVVSPEGGSILFNANLYHTSAGSSGADWGNGYTGDTYSSSSGLVLTMPVNTYAVDFYAQPGAPVPYDVVATATDGKTLELSLSGDGEAQQFFFYAQKGETIQSIALSIPSTANGITIGQFGIDPVPEPSTLALLAVAVCGAAVYRRMQSRRKKQ
jgi:hypothetical protein